jgi:hypothetical protein
VPLNGSWVLDLVLQRGLVKEKSRTTRTRLEAGMSRAHVRILCNARLWYIDDLYQLSQPKKPYGLYLFTTSTTVPAKVPAKSPSPPGGLLPRRFVATGSGFCWRSHLVSHATEHLSRVHDQLVFALGFLHGPSTWRPSPRDSYQENFIG